MDAKAQHYLSRFYLRNFAKHGKKKKEYYIWYFDKQTGQRVRTNIKNVCHEQGFYKFKGSEDNVINWDTWITETEGKLESALTALCEDFTIETFDSNFLPLVTLVAFLMLRSATVRKDVKDMIDGYINKQIATMPADKKVKEFTDNDARFQHYEIMREDLEKVAEAISDKKWVLVKNETPHLFLTSDYLFAIEHPKDQKIWPIDVGIPTDELWLESPGARVFFPITPHKMLMICDPLEGTQFPRMIGLNPEFIQSVNEGQVYRSQRFVFSCDGNFTLVERMLRKYPHLRHTDRPRWKVVTYKDE